MGRETRSSSAEATLRDERWAAVMDRAASADGRFVYAVRTTGIYCRPICAARRPRPENVVFFDTPSGAEQQGFRACKRCRPDRDGAGDASRSAEVVALCRMIESAEEPPSLADLAAHIGRSASYTRRVFQAATGLTPKAYATAQTAQRVRDHLPNAPSVTAAFHRAGYGSAGRFYEAADATLGMPPRAYRAGGSGIAIRFALGECTLGHILVAATDRGVCAILLGDDPDVLLEDLAARFQHAETTGGDAAFDRVVAQVVGLVEQPRLGLDLPLDIRGTAFQQRVWAELSRVPAGETVSYAQLAARIDQPTAARAVARAVAANPLAVAIPCHRVIRTDGGMGGYRWGIERKQSLLRREASAERRTARG